MNKIIHFFDLDSTLWNLASKWWIVAKSNPSEPLIRITQEEGAHCLSGHYKKDNLFVEAQYPIWISASMWEEIQNLNSNIKLNDLDLRFDEFSERKHLDFQAEHMYYYLDNIKHLIRHNDTIGLLTARGGKTNHDLLLKKLRDVLWDEGVHIEDRKIYFVNDPSLKRLHSSSSELKACILAEHLLGYKIYVDGFRKEQQDLYDEVHFYDDEWKNIETCNDINKIVKKYLSLTKDTIIVKEIEHRINNNNLKLVNYFVPPNKEKQIFNIHIENNTENVSERKIFNYIQWIKKN